MIHNRQTLVMVTPLPPQRNGIADYAALVITALAQDYDIVAVVEDGVRASPVPGARAILPQFDYLHRPDLHQALHIYQVGNNPDHVFMLPWLAKRPGLVVLHDPSLHHLLDCATEANGDHAGYAAALRAEFGQAGAALARQYFAHGVRGRAMFAAMPMIRGIAGPSRGFIVHSTYAATRVAGEVEKMPVTIVPHPVMAPPIPEQTRAAVRANFAVPSNGLLLVSLGFITKAKQIDVILQALADTADRLPPFHYVIAGAANPQECDAQALAASLGLAHSVTITGYVDPSQFDQLIHAADILLNVRFPDFGETSGTLARALAMGCCAVVSDSGAVLDLPNDTVVKLPGGPPTPAALAAALISLAANPARRRRIGAKAAAWSATNRALSCTAAGYRAAIEAARPAPPWSARPLGWSCTTLSERRVKAQADQPLWEAHGLAPTPIGPCRLVTCTDTEAEAESFSKGVGLAPDTILRFPQSLAALTPRDADLIFWAGGCAALPADATALLRAVNHALAFGGRLVGELRCHPGDPPHVWMRRTALAAAIAASGFQLEACETALPPLMLANGETENIAWSAVKVTEFFHAPAEGSKNVRF